MVMRPPLPPPNLNFMRGPPMPPRPPPPHLAPPLQHRHHGPPPGRIPPPMPHHRLRGPPPPPPGPPGPMNMPFRFRPRPPPPGPPPYAMPPYSPKRMMRPIGHPPRTLGPPPRTPGPHPPRRMQGKSPPNTQLMQNHCHNCGWDFLNAEKLANHQAEHEVCGIDGCKFTAHSKLVAFHIQNVHRRSGVYEKINLDSALFREERKKNFPTIERNEAAKRKKEASEKEKEAKKKERFDRGESVDCNKKRFEDKKNVKTGPFNRRMRNQKGAGKNRRIIRRLNNAEKDTEEEPLKEPEIIYNDKCPGFRGTAYHQNQETVESSEDICNSNNFSDDEYLFEESHQKVEIDEPKPVSSSLNALGSLIADYGSDSDDPPDEVPVIVEKSDVGNLVQQHSKQEDTTSKFEVMINKDLDGGPEELPGTESLETQNNSPNIPNNEEISQSDVANNITENDSRKRKRKTNKELSLNDSKEKRRKMPVPQPKRKPTLYQKFLANEIRHERNTILQCVRHLVKKKII